MSHARELLATQIANGKTHTAIAREIGYSRPAVSRYVDGSYGAEVRRIEEAIVKAYDRRICPHDGEEKQPQHCRRVAFRPRPWGFPDAEALWIACQGCPHRPDEAQPMPQKTPKPPRKEKSA